MIASVLIAKLQTLIEEHGDLQVIDDEWCSITDVIETKDDTKKVFKQV